MTSILSKARRFGVGLIAALLLPLTAVQAQTAITSGNTQVRLDAPIATAILGAGVTPSALGTGRFDLPTLTFTFPITGGTLSPGVIPGSTIRHNGSGIRFAAGAISLEIGDFLIDTTSLQISGFARSTAPVQGSVLNATSVPLFALGTGGTTAFPFIVSLTSAAAGALNATFGTTLFSANQRIGLAQTLPSTAAVPEPAALGLMGLGLAGVVAIRRRRPAQA